MSGRKVFVSSDMSVDERLLLVSEQNGMVSLLWPWLLTALDDWGRCEATPLRLKARIWPMNDTVSVALVSEALDLFTEVELIERYDVDGRAYLRVPPARWWKWQTHIHRDKREDDKSRIPAPDHEQCDRVDLRVHARESALVTPTPRSRAGSRGTTHESAPSPSPSPSLSPSPSPTDLPNGEVNLLQRERARDLVADADASSDALSVALIRAPVFDKEATETTDVRKDLREETAAKGATTAMQTRATSTATNVTPLPTARLRDPVWDACIASMGVNGAAPSNRVERGRWAKGIQALKESLAADGSPPTEIVTRAARYRSRFGSSVPLHPMALAGNWTTLATDIPTTHGTQEGQRHGNFTHRQQQSGTGTAAHERSASGYGARGGKPAVGSAAYYAAAIARQANQHGGAPDEGIRDAVVG
jgi:hypothetical protein